MTPRLLLDAVISADEQKAVSLAAEKLRRSFSNGASAIPVLLRMRDRSSTDAPTPGSLALISLSADVASAEPLARIEAAWLERIAYFRGAGCAAVFILTVFQHAPGDPSMQGRIRRLNMLAISLSHATGVGVVDIDRLFSLLGARFLGADYRLGGVLAEEAAAHAIVQTLLGVGLGDLVPWATQDQARAAHGGVNHLPQLVQRLRELSPAP